MRYKYADCIYFVHEWGLKNTGLHKSVGHDPSTFIKGSMNGSICRLLLLGQLETILQFLRLHTEGSCGGGVGSHHTVRDLTELPCFHHDISLLPSVVPGAPKSPPSLAQLLKREYILGTEDRGGAVCTLCWLGQWI